MSSHHPLETVSVAEAATNRLREDLFSGAYQAGEEIKDTHIATTFGIARPTARIAVQQLITEGILVRPPGYSARVRTFDPEQVKDIYRVRKLIELDAVREIKTSSLDLSAVSAALRAFSGLQETGANWSEIAAADVRFHSAVVDTGGSPRLRAYFAAINSEVRLLIAFLQAQYTRQTALYEEHEQLFLLLSGSAPVEEVVAGWLTHLESAENFLSRHLS